MTQNHYFTTKLVKMGAWKLWPGDCDAWFSEEVSTHFKKRFGLPKPLLMLWTMKDGTEHAYIPAAFLKALGERIDEITKKDFKGLEKTLLEFYDLRKELKRELSSINPPDLSSVSNTELAEAYRKNRSCVHRATVFDQFGWLAEEHWTPLMEYVLATKLGIPKNSSEYHRVIFALTKPEEISTTLEEKRSTLREAIAIKKNETTVEEAGAKLAKAFGWMPVFAFGTPWDSAWYENELRQLTVKSIEELEAEYAPLRDYSKRRNADIDAIVKEYDITPRDLQIFIDFGLALDGRNEAEYIVSFAGGFLMPLYAEMAKRLAISTTDLRKLYEEEMILCLLGQADVKKLLSQRREFAGCGWDESATQRRNFSEDEARELWNHVDASVTSIQGNEENKGVCASPGIAKGKARILHSPAENNKVEAGDILITHATTVDYLPAMKKAAAIVTEIGGLTCHAAVVSREFGIPCVVALKNAMKIFKDGEMIEVNADAGSVTAAK